MFMDEIDTCIKFMSRDKINLLHDKKLLPDLAFTNCHATLFECLQHIHLSL